MSSQNNPEVSSDENSNINKNVQVNQPAKEERIRELNQQVDSLQNVILQVNISLYPHNKCLFLLSIYWWHNCDESINKDNVIITQNGSFDP